MAWSETKSRDSLSAPFVFHCGAISGTLLKVHFHHIGSVYKILIVQNHDFTIVMNIIVIVRHLKNNRVLTAEVGAWTLLKLTYSVSSQQK